MGRADPFSLGGPCSGSVSDPVSDPARTIDTDEEGTNGRSADPMSDEYPLIGVDPSSVKGSVICDPLFSDSQRGMTLNGGMPGGMDDAGDVSRDRELSIQESDSFELTWTLCKRLVVLS